MLLMGCSLSSLPGFRNDCEIVLAEMESLNARVSASHFIGEGKKLKAKPVPNYKGAPEAETRHRAIDFTVPAGIDSERPHSLVKLFYFRARPKMSKITEPQGRWIV
jgi:hypothetical protein